MSAGSDERVRCPYVGLQPFEERDHEFFFGRERDQHIIISNLLSSPLTILYGASGVGKSSVLMAGVIPQLRRERPKTPVVVFRNWVDRDFQLALKRACIDAVWALHAEQPKPAESLPLDEVLRACGEAAHGPVLVLFDQFEEYFLYHPKSTDPNSFEAQFARAVNRDDVDVGFLIALRDDSLSKLDRFQERIHNLMSNRLRLNHLDTAGAAVAIRKPLEVWNARLAPGQPHVDIEEGLIDELLREVRIGEVSAGRHGGSGGRQTEDGYIEAPFLQLVMVRLWEEEREAQSCLLRRATLDRLKGANEIVRTHLDNAMARLDETSQAVCASFFDRLVTPTGSKVACSAADLTSWAGELAPRVPAVLGALADARNRILRTVAVPDRPDATRYEVFHDVLAPAILDWRRRYVADQGRAAEVRKAREQAAKRALRQWLFALGVMAGAAITGWIYASWEERRSAANQKAAESISIAPFDAGRALDLALEAVEATAPFGLSPTFAARIGLAPTAAAEDSLRQAMQASRLVWTLPVSRRWVSDLAFSPDGRQLATADQDKMAKLWNITGGRPQAPLASFSHDKWVRNVAFLPGGDRIVTSAEEKAYLWALDAPQTPLRSFDHGSPIYSAFAVSQDGRRLATGGDGERKARAIKVWDLDGAAGETVPLTTLDTGGAWVMGLAFSPDGCCLATACVERGDGARTAAGMWSLKTGAEILRLPLTEASDAVAFTQGGKALVTASRDAWVRVWQPAGETLDELLGRVGGSNPPPGAELSQHPDWSVRILAGHGDRVRDVAVSPDGRYIASSAGDSTARIWDSETGENLLTLGGHTSFVEAVKFSPDGRNVATASRDGTVKFWNIEGHFKTVTSLAFNADGRLLVTGSSDRTARIWDLSGGAPTLVHALRGHTGQVFRVAFAPGGTQVATAGLDNTVRLWDVATGAQTAILQKHKDQLRGLAFSPDGKRLASSGADGYAWLYELDGAGFPAVGVSHAGKSVVQASSVAFHPKEERWATSGYDGKLRLWDFSAQNVGTIELSETARASGTRIAELAFSPDGTHVAAVVQRRVYLWPVSAFGMPRAEPAATFIIDGVRYCSAIAYSHDGRQLAVACNDAGVRIFDMDRLELAKTITVHKNDVRDLAFSPDGTRLATASSDKTFHVSLLRFDELYAAATRLRRETENGEE
ncbi:WD40 repeat domain-containing protein [Aromatoleum petrolei]|uniref:Novel STAND NTPase 1 domain-containing protein n=1 Tax=Aromatoleum petrolei TaxID=76116 RepID=A0ABX1MVD3_9RHOO|nr:WD40 repeat domain-containing protein [Aromatoleum petrolei]NMF91191.1 hypothetical protein [Aromatoleum petrolei]QTQ35449.1 WD40/YVTN repeat-like-containing domain superfamily protein [Aromatoleum petrolei]